MLLIGKEELNQLLEKKYQEGVEIGVKIMKERMLLACENGTPIELSDGRAYFVRSDIQNLRTIFDTLEREGRSE